MKIFRLLTIAAAPFLVAALVQAAPPEGKGKGGGKGGAGEDGTACYDFVIDEEISYDWQGPRYCHGDD